MKFLKIKMVFWMLCFFVAGCALGPSSVLKPEKHEPETIPDQIKAESDDLAQTQNRLQRSLAVSAPKPIDVAPVIPVYDPLEDHIVSFSMVDEDIMMMLYSLSQAVGINFIVDPEITREKQKLTLNFEKVSAATVLREILDTFDLYYEIDRNVIRIRPYQERIFNLNFLNTSVRSSFEVGGDVLGAGETETASGLTGSFKMTGEGAKVTNAYDNIEEMVKQMVSQGGRYSMNRMSGSLYIKDRPTVVRSVSKLVHHFRETLGRQILIEARIIEVILRDEYAYGIDWSVLKDLQNAATEILNASWSLGNGLILGGTSGDYSLSATLDALNTFGDAKVISNPTLRSKHGKPAMISVGTSITYKKSVTTTRTSSAVERPEETTDVEVSTVFDGLILGIIPFIEKDGTVNLLINPIKSDVDPNSLEEVSVGTDASISLPEVRIKEISTTISVRPGDVAILGGLIDKEKFTVNQGVPFLSAIPGIGYLFKNETTREENRELVVMLSVNLI